MLIKERDWYREWYQSHVGHAPSSPTKWEKEHWARLEKTRTRRQRWAIRARRVGGWIVLTGATALIAHAAYYVFHGLNLQDSMAAMRYDWAFYLGPYLP